MRLAVIISSLIYISTFAKEHYTPTTIKEIEELKKFAEQGNVNAQLSLAFAYILSDGCKKDDAEALKWFIKAADQNSIRAEWNVALCYDNGEGTQMNKIEAIKWYKKVYFNQKPDDKEAKSLKAGSRNRLGQLYLYDEKARDYNQAIRWLRESADYGSDTALNNLGLCYYNGWGVTKNLVEAFAYFNLSQSNEKSNSGIDYLQLLKTVLTPSEIEEGQKRSKQLKHEMEHRKAEMERKWWQFWK